MSLASLVARARVGEALAGETAGDGAVAAATTAATAGVEVPVMTTLAAGADVGTKEVWQGIRNEPRTQGEPKRKGERRNQHKPERRLR